LNPFTALKINKAPLILALGLLSPVVNADTSLLSANTFYSIKNALNSAVSTVSDTSKGRGATLTTSNEISGKGKIAYVIDGDTAWVSVNRTEFNEFLAVADTKDKKKALRTDSMQVKMRIGGINTAESEHRIKSKNSAFGKAASNYLKGWASGGSAEYSCYAHGYYSRPICAVSANGFDIGYDMIKNGYSDYDTSWGKHPYFDAQYKKVSK